MKQEKLLRSALAGCALCMVLFMVLLTGCGAGKQDQQPGRNAAIPVVVSTVSQQTVPLMLAAVGNLIAVDNAAVRARVDGQLMKVAFKEGAEVTAGQVLLQLDARPYQAALAQALANLAKDQASLERARAQRQRYDDLIAKAYVSADDYAQVKANEQTAAAAVQADEAAVQTARLNLDYCTMRAPISGRTGVLALRAGNLIKAADNLVLTTITRMDPLYAEFAVPQQFLDALRAGVKNGTAMVTLASNEGRDYVHPSKLDFIDNTVDNTNGTVRVRATVRNADRSLWPQQFVHVRLALADATPVLTIPLSALGSGPEGNFVFVVDDAGRVHQQPVTVERQTDTVAIIAKGLSAGNQVVSDGQSRLQDGALIARQRPVN